MIRAIQKDDVLLADVAQADDSPEYLHFWWLGQSGFLVKQAGRMILLDPYLSDSLTHKYAATDKPHTRMTERCLEPSRLSGLDWVTASHVHTDHLDGETLVHLAGNHQALPILLPWPVIPEAQKRLSGADVSLIGLNEGECWESPHGWRVRGVAAAHNELLRDELGRCHYLGFIVEKDGFTFYHSGDTLWHDGLIAALREVRCDVMFLPINGNRPERRVSGNLNGTEAAALAKACGARLVVPCHYDMFTFNTETPEEFVTACERLGQPYRVMRCGERVTLKREA